MIDIDALEALVGALPKWRAHQKVMTDPHTFISGDASVSGELALAEAYERLKEKAADLTEARFFADGWHKQFRRVNAARHEEKTRAEKAEDEARKLRDLLQLTLRSGINVIAPNRDTREAMIQRVVDERMTDLLARYDAKHGGEGA